MRIDIKKTEVYPFAELTDDAKQTALEQLADINVDYEWWECIYEDAANVGIKIIEFDLGRGSYCKGDFTLDAEEIATKIKMDHGANCKTCKTACAFLGDILNIEEDTIEYEEIKAEFRRSILEDYRIMLEKHYEYLCGEEAIIETIEANEYEFTADGKLY